MDLIDEYAEHLREDLDRADSTIDLYVGVLRRMNRELPAGLESAHADEIRDWINDGGRRGAAARALYRTITGGFFAWACNPAAQILDFNPTQLIPRVRVPATAPRLARDEQLADILRRAEQPYALWILVAAFGGLRCTELAALDREHITAEYILVHGKGRKQRLVPTHELVWAAVRDLPPGPVVRSAAGGRATRQQISKRIARHMDHLGYPGVRAHMLRRWFGTRAYDASARDIRAVQDLLGHANVSTTQRYVAVAEPARASAVRGLPTLGLDAAGAAQPARRAS